MTETEKFIEEYTKNCSNQVYYHNHRFTNGTVMENKYCYMCEHFIGSHPDDEDFEDGEGMCPFTSVYTNAFDCVCGEELLFEEYK